MPKTAFSKHFHGEYDLPQLLRLAGHSDIEGPDPAEISPSIRTWIASDVLCPGCSAIGASVVSAAKSKTTGGTRAQAHFRFGRRPDGSDAHDALCEFYGDKENVDRTRHLVDFNSARSDQTKAIRQLVCNGIAIGAFTQQTMRDMRLWFLQFRKDHSSLLEIDENDIRQCAALMDASHNHSPPFRPSMALLSELNLRALARRALCDQNLDLLDERRRIGGWLHEKDLARVIRLCQKWQGQRISDPNLLAKEYDQAIELANFMCAYSKTKPWPTIARFTATSPSVDFLLALSALLLFATSWDSGRAIDTFVRIRIAPPALDDLAGNIIGLNPFHDYTTWNSLVLVAHLKALRPDGWDLIGDLRKIEAEMKLAFESADASHR